jgi:hypothetical protein
MILLILTQHNFSHVPINIITVYCINAAQKIKILFGSQIKNVCSCKNKSRQRGRENKKSKE